MNEITLSNQWQTLWESDSRYFVFTGGRGSGKSYAVTYFLIDLIRSESGHIVLFSRKTMTSARISIIPMFQQVLKDSGVEEEFEVTNDEITHKLSGSKIWFKGLQTSNGDNTANLKSIPITTWVLDEAEELKDEELFDKVDLSIRNQHKDNRVILVLNPTTKEHFIYNKFFEEAGIFPGSNTTKEGITTIHSTWMDNTDHLSESFITQALLMQKKAPEQYEKIMLGGWRDKAEGTVFTNWEVGEGGQGLQSVYGYDDGYSPDPAAMVETKIDKVSKTIYIKELIYHTQMVESEKVSKIKEYSSGGKVYCEHSGSIIESCKRQGVNAVKAIKGPGSVLKGISTLQDYKLVIHPDSINLVKELNNYAWDSRKSDTPIDKYNHLIDALRYSISDLFGFSGPSTTHKSTTRHRRPSFR